MRGEGQKPLAVRGSGLHFRNESFEFALVDETTSEREEFDAADGVVVLTILRIDEIGGLKQRIRRSGVEPLRGIRHAHGTKTRLLKIKVVEIRDFKFSASGRTKTSRLFPNVGRIEVEPDRDKIGGRNLRFLDNADHLALFVAFGNAEALRIGDLFEQDGSFVRSRLREMTQFEEFFAKDEDVVAQDEADGLIDEVVGNEKAFGDAVWGVLHPVAELQSQMRAVSKKLLDVGKIPRRGDDEDLANAELHQDCQRVINHRLVVDGKKLLRNEPGHGSKATSAASGENDAFHKNLNCSPYSN